jgi:hypothetical protein
MRLDLQRLDVGGLDLTFGANPEREHRIALAGATGLSGEFSQAPDSVRLDGVLAESLLVALLQLRFSSFEVNLHEQGILSTLSGTYERKSGTTELQLMARSLRAPDLELDFSTFQVRGQLFATNVRLEIAGGRGRVQAESFELVGLRMKSAIAVTAQRLMAKNVDVSWQPGGYRVRIDDVELPHAVAKASDELFAVPEGEDRAEPAARQSGLRGLIDWKVLDGLSGAVDVDVVVDLKVPIIGSRRATHPFRVSIRSGTVNYLDLESNLSALEDSILDFAVRDESLVLERGIPLLPTRGRGKPIIVWPLDPDDLALTNEDRVRLAVLPRGRLANSNGSSSSDAGDGAAKRADDQADSNEKSPPVALQQLDLVDLQAVLRLEPSSEGGSPLRDLSFEDLRLQGTVHHSPDSEPQSGELTGALRGLMGKVVQLALGSSHLSLDAFRLGELTQVEVPFLGVRPQRLSCEVVDFNAKALWFGKHPEAERGT